MNSKIEMHIAVHALSGDMVGIDKANKGKNCGCLCWSCKGELVAKKGEKNQWHFAHSQNSKKKCDYSFWVVCRDLARQIFASQKLPLKCIRLSNDIGITEISDISFNNTKVGDKTFELSFDTQEYGRVFVYFITPEQNRYHFDTTVSFPENVLLIDLTNIEYKKEDVTKELYSIIINGINLKNFFDKKKLQLTPIIPINGSIPKISLFDELEEEEKAQKKSFEIIQNTPEISCYDPSLFKEMLRNPKFEIIVNRFTPKDLACIDGLDKIFLGFYKTHGYNENKHFFFKEIDQNKMVYFASYNERFIGFVLLDIKYVVFVPKEKTLIPVMSTSYKDGIPKKIKQSIF